MAVQRFKGKNWKKIGKEMDLSLLVTSLFMGSTFICFFLNYFLRNNLSLYELSTRLNALQEIGT